MFTTFIAPIESPILPKMAGVSPFSQLRNERSEDFPEESELKSESFKANPPPTDSTEEKTIPNYGKITVSELVFSYE